MRSRTSFACALAALWLAFSSPAIDAETDASTVESADVEAALEKLEEDPNLASSRKTRTPKWRSEPDEEQQDSSVFEWIVELFRWIAQASRVFVWVVIALLIGALALYLFRFLRALPDRPLRDEPLPPTHVRDLDIRPESLPDDIGAAAWSTWERGDQRAALSLLYRGLLSMLVHAYSAPIRSSSTEGDCLELARARLPASSGEFAGRLIDVWQRAVYGGQSAQTQDVRALCAEFAAMLARTPAAAESAP